MRKVLVTFLLALSGAALVQGSPKTQARQPADQANAPASQKVIRDRAEYDAYITALNTQDLAAKAAAMEAFVKQYPQSTVLVDALEQAMAAYQQVGNAPQTAATARRILQITPNHIRALAMVVWIDRVTATAGGTNAAPALKEGCAYSQTGLQQLPSWSRPEGISDLEFRKLRDRMSAIFNGAVGFCSLQNKDYAGARSAYQKSVAIDPNNLQDVYQLALADLEMNPVDVNGFWYCSKAISIAKSQNNAAKIAAVCKAEYKRYHGGDDGWEQIAAQPTEKAPPADFPSRIKPAPTPCELAVHAVEWYGPANLSDSDRVLILSRANCSPANKAAADKVWQFIQNENQKGSAYRVFRVKVISSTQVSMEVAATDEDQAANKADMHVIMEGPMLHPPAPGSTFTVTGLITGYTPSPFMLTMRAQEGVSVVHIGGPTELALELAQKEPLKTLPVTDWEIVLNSRDASPANKDAADRVWAAIQAMQKDGGGKIRLPAVKIISLTQGGFDAAVTQFNKDGNKADVHVIMEKVMQPLPAPGSTTDIVGAITSYTPEPFMLTLEKGELPGPNTPAYPQPAMDPFMKIHCETSLSLADWRFRQKDYKGAASSFREALACKPDDPEITFNLAESLNKLGRFDEARAAYRRYLELLPNGPYAKQAKAAIRGIESASGR